jgi:hypothetical protein
MSSCAPRVRRCRKEAEARWAALQKRARVTDEIDLYMFGGRMFAGLLLLLSALIMPHRLLYGERRRTIAAGVNP